MSGRDVRITNERTSNGWVGGEYIDADGSYTFFAKVFDDPCSYGFATPESASGGRVGKMTVNEKSTGCIACHFDHYGLEANGVDNDRARAIVMAIATALERSIKADKRLGATRFNESA